MPMERNTEGKTGCSIHCPVGQSDVVLGDVFGISRVGGELGEGVGPKEESHCQRPSCNQKAIISSIHNIPVCLFGGCEASLTARTSMGVQERDARRLRRASWPFRVHLNILVGVAISHPFFGTSSFPLRFARGSIENAAIEDGDWDFIGDAHPGCPITPIIDMYPN